jgi:hypothetical protein
MPADRREDYCYKKDLLHCNFAVKQVFDFTIAAVSLVLLS